MRLSHEVVVLLDGKQTGEKFTAFLNISPPSDGPGPHYHEREDEWFYIVEGRVSFFLNRTWTDMFPGVSDAMRKYAVDDSYSSLQKQRAEADDIESKAAPRRPRNRPASFVKRGDDFVLASKVDLIEGEPLYWLRKRSFGVPEKIHPLRQGIDENQYSHLAVK